MIKKVLGWLTLAFVIFYIATNPKGAADVFGTIGGGIGDVATGFGTFFTNLVT